MFQTTNLYSIDIVSNYQTVNPLLSGMLAGFDAVYPVLIATHT